MQRNLLKNVLESGYEPTYDTSYDYNNVPEAEDLDISGDDNDPLNEGSLNDEEDLDQSDLIWLPGIEEIAES